MRKKREADPVAVRMAVRKWKERNQDKVRARRLVDGARRAAKNGKVYIPREQRIAIAVNLLCEKNARQAWDYWIRVRAPDEWVLEYWESAGTPWRNQRLSDAERYRVRYARDERFAINERMRRQIRKEATRDGVSELIRGALKRGGRSSKVEDLLGYSIDELRAHIEKQFTKGMNWDKFVRGEIHIDHVIPKASFDLSDKDEWLSCWSLPNLRPLFRADNLLKSDRVENLV